MNTIKSNTCGGNGCSIRVILPHDRRMERISSEMLPQRDDIKMVLRAAQDRLFKIAA